MTTDVLTSIKRTEDSLMRLKRSRKQAGTGASGQAGSQENPSTMSDDDKIRLQFTLDTEEFGRAVRVKIDSKLEDCFLEERVHWLFWHAFELWLGVKERIYFHITSHHVITKPTRTLK